MKSLTGRKAISHERIVKAGSRAIRRVGFEGVSVADVMKDAGLTHGGFYAHFESRDELLSQSLLSASQDIADRIRHHMARLTQAGVSPFRAFVETYLYEDHIGDCENGCPVSVVSPEAPRQSPEVIDASRRAINSLRKQILEVLPKGAPPESAWSIAGSLIGALQLARVMGGAGQGRAVLDAAKHDLLTLYDAPQLPPPGGAVFAT
jgi:TetR/AcrR family transcriptional regulator, transcriptional repressor for nem operon